MESHRERDGEGASMLESLPAVIKLGEAEEMIRMIRRCVCVCVYMYVFVCVCVVVCVKMFALDDVFVCLCMWMFFLYVCTLWFSVCADR